MQSQGLHSDAYVATSPALHELWNAVGQLFSADAEFFRQLERVDEHLDCAFLEDTVVEFAAVVVPLAFAREFADGLAHVVKAVADGKGLFLFRRHTGQCRVVLQREGVALADILHNGGKRCKTSHESLSFRVLNTDGHYGIEITLTEGAPFLARALIEKSGNISPCLNVLKIRSNLFQEPGAYRNPEELVTLCPFLRRGIL